MGRKKANGSKSKPCYQQPPVPLAVKLSAEVSTLRLANERMAHEVEALRATVATYDQVAEARVAATEVQVVEGSLSRMADELKAAIEKASAGMQASIAEAARLGEQYGQAAKSALSSARSVRSDARKAVEQVTAADDAQREQLELAIFERNQLRERIGELTTREGLAPVWMLAELEVLVKRPNGADKDRKKGQYVDKILRWAMTQRARAKARDALGVVPVAEPVDGDEDVGDPATDLVATTEPVADQPDA